MIRHCDGTDPNLLRAVEFPNDGPTYRPCDCGRQFDDVQFEVIWPHHRVLSQEDKAELIRLFTGDESERWTKGRVAYAIYGYCVGHKNYQGLPMPKWDDLTQEIRNAWITVGGTIYGMGLTHNENPDRPRWTNRE